MKLDEAKKYIAAVYPIGGLICEIEKSVISADEICNQIAQKQTISLPGGNYLLDYEPAIAPIKNLYEEYIKAFTSSQDYFVVVIRQLMDDLTNAILKPDDSDLTDKKLNSANSTFDDCSKTKDLAKNFFNLMNTTIKIVAKNVDDKNKQSSLSPAEIKKYYVDNAKVATQYDSSTRIPAGFDKLKEQLEKLDGSLNDLSSVASYLADLQNKSDHSEKMNSLKQIYDLFNMMSKSIAESIKNAAKQVEQLKKDIKDELAKKVSPITEAFDRIVPSKPALRTDTVFSVVIEGNGLKAYSYSFDEFLKKTENKAVATLTISSICAFASTRNNGDFRGLFKLSSLKQVRVISSDAEILFVVDDGYSEIKLHEGEIVNSSDFNKEEEVYFSENAFKKLKEIPTNKESKTKRL